MYIYKYRWWLVLMEVVVMVLMSTVIILVKVWLLPYHRWRWWL